MLSKNYTCKVVTKKVKLSTEINLTNALNIIIKITA